MTWANARRVVQGLFLALFLIVLIRTTLIGEDDTAPLATFFFDIDPLAFLATWIASGSVLPGMFLALITVGLTLLLGRFFCGWVCPMGTTFNLISVGAKRPPAHLIRTGTWNQWQKSKYLLLIGLLAAALTGLHLAGIFDPISLLYRTVATSIYPALVWASHQLFTWLYFADPGIGPVRVTLISEPIYSFLRAWVLTPQPVAYVGGVLIGAFFIGLSVLAMSHFRFWCRYICPLGGLLGACSKTTRIELRLDSNKCEQCNMCVAYCPGACDPHLAGRWKKEECYFCFTCREQCPDGAISFHWKWGGKSREIIPPLTPGQAPKPAVLSNVTEA
jgi:polyferredoxin